MNRRKLIAFAGAAAAWPATSRAQPARQHRIGYLSPSSFAAHERLGFIRAIQEGLRQRGYVEGSNIAFHSRWANLRYERLADLAAELVALKVDVILTHATPGASAAQAATATIPIVVVVAGDLVASGLVASLARPGGNLTGQHIFTAEVAAKRLELIKEALPRAARIAVLVNPANVAVAPTLGEMERTASALRVELLRVEARAADEFDRAFATMAQKGVDALVLIEEPVFTANADQIAERAARSRIPTVAPPEAKAGALITFGVDIRELFFRAASFVDRILKGAKPGDLPIERATKFEITVNLKRAKALGLALPPAILLRADEVIE